MSWLIIIGSILCLGGVAGILFLVVRKMPTLAKLSEIPQPVVKEKFFENFTMRLREVKYSTYPPIILNWLEKNLRKFHLLILKMDNFFVKWIKSSRERSEVWTIRSRAFLEHRRIKRREKAQLLEKLDKVEVSESLEKIHKEVAKEEDSAFKEKVAIVNSVEEEKIIEPAASEVVEQQPEEEEILTVSEEEKRYIDAIAQNPKDVDSYRALCDIYLTQQSYADARACFRQVLKLDPSDEATKAKLESIKGLRSAKKQSEGELAE